MLKDMLASGTAKLIAACVCPVVGASALTLAVPKVRSAVHDATAPKRLAAVKPRGRGPVRPVAPRARSEGMVICPQPAVLGGPDIAPTDIEALADMLAAASRGTSGSGAIGSAANRSGPGFLSITSPSLAGGGGQAFATAPDVDGGRTPGEGAPGVDEAPDIGSPSPDPTLTPATIVPEPKTWIQLLLGFGLIGGLLRARRWSLRFKSVARR